MIWRWFWREWRAPSLLIVWLALTLAVACVLALGTISDRMEKGLSQQSRDFLAGDRFSGRHTLFQRRGYRKRSSRGWRLAANSHF